MQVFQENKKFIAFFVLGIFLLSFASASFLPIKEYNSEEQKVTIVNTLGLGRNIAEIKLNTPLKVFVPIGYQKVAEFEINNYKDYKNALENMEFYDVKNKMKSIERVFDYKIKINESYSVNDYKLEKLIRTHTEYRENWVPLEKIDFTKGEKLTIGIFTYVNEYDNVEWVPTYYGKEITEWASFVQSSGTETTDGLYTIRTFTSNGTFNVTGDYLNVSVLIVAGGGAGGRQGGGGGAGGLIFNNSYLVNGNINVVVGIGGINVADRDFAGGNGTISSFGTLTATGGGGGSAWGHIPGGEQGGSGGGSAYGQGTGKIGHGIAGQGNNGGLDRDPAPAGSGGGGGAGAVGQSTDSSGNSGDGGIGLAYTIYNGTALYYAGGGGAGAYLVNHLAYGGLGGGGNGDTRSAGGSDISQPGINGTGGGGGGGSENYNGANGGSGIVIVRYLTSDASSTLNVTLNSPENYFNTTNPSITFNISSITSYNDLKNKNVSLILDGVLNETNSSEINGTYIFTKILSEGDHNYSVISYGNNLISTQSATRYFTIDTISPVINITYPINTTYYTNYTTENNVSIWFNWTASDSHLDKCWYNNGTTNITITCNSNSSAYFPYGGKTYIAYANDTFGHEISLTRTATWAYKILQNSINYSNLSYESAIETFLINVSLGEAKALTGTLVYNGTSYSSIQSGSSLNYFLTKTLTIPISGNNTFYWSFNYGGEIINSTTFMQNISAITLTNCTSGTSFINLSFYDEKTQVLLDPTNNISIKMNFLYYMEDIAVNKTLNNTFIANNISLCFTPASENVTLHGEIEYEDGLHVKRRYYFIYDTFSNITTSIRLYDLLSSQSTSFVVYIYDSESLAVQNAYMKLRKKFTESGEYKIVEMSRSDDIGLGIMHFVSEDNKYIISYYDSNGNLLYTTNEFSAVCIESLCSITHTIPYSVSLDPFSEITGNSDFIYAISDSNESISVVYNSLNGTGYNVLMEVDGMSVINDSIRICTETQSSSYSGMITCNISASNFDNHLLKVWVNGKLQVSRYIQQVSDDYKSYGKEGIFYAIMIILALTLIFAWSWVLCLIGCVIGVLISIYLHFIPGTIATGAYLIVIVVYLIVSGGDR